MPDNEEYEHIPWSELIAADDDRRNRLLYIAAGAVIAVVVGAVGARWLLASDAPSTVVAPVPSSTVDEQPEPSADVVPPDSAPADERPLYAEADLMAAVAGPGAATAATRAEWFVTDFFTADLDPAGAAEVRAALPAGAILPGLPHEGPGTSVSFVEWARALDVQTVGDGIFRVTVAFRTIGASGDTTFRRLPVRIVAIVVAVGPEGGTRVLDLPQPVEAPDVVVAQAAPAASSSVDPAIADVARRVGRSWGSDVEVIGGAAIDDAWRVEVLVSDDADNRWPLVVWLDDAGEIASPPWLP